jgi:hypothetical protein
MRFRLRTLLLIWLVMAPSWLVLIVKAATDNGPSPAYPFGCWAELAVLGILLAGLTAAVAYWTIKAVRPVLRSNSPMFRFKLRTLAIASAVIPPVASLVWFMFRTEILPPTLASLEIVIPTAVATVIVISWLDELVEYLSRHRPT